MFLIGGSLVLLLNLLIVVLFMMLFGVIQAIFSGTIGSRAAGVSTSSVFDIAGQFWILWFFPPVALLLIYPFVFLLGNDAKYLYKTLIKNNQTGANL